MFSPAPSTASESCSFRSQQTENAQPTPWSASFHPTRSHPRWRNNSALRGIAGFRGLFVPVAFGVSLPQRSYPDENHGPAPGTIRLRQAAHLLEARPPSRRPRTTGALSAATGRTSTTRSSLDVQDENPPRLAPAQAVAGITPADAQASADELGSAAAESAVNSVSIIACRVRVSGLTARPTKRSRSWRRLSERRLAPRLLWRFGDCARS